MFRMFENVLENFFGSLYGHVTDPPGGGPLLWGWKKMHRFESWISPKVIEIGLRYLWGIYINIISFFSHNFHGRNFYPLRNFDRKPKIEGVRKGEKSIPEAKKSDFFAISKVIRTIWRETPELIYVHISSLIEYEYRPNRPIYQNSKIMIFWPFFSLFLHRKSA